MQVGIWGILLLYFAHFQISWCHGCRSENAHFGIPGYHDEWTRVQDYIHGKGKEDGLVESTFAVVYLHSDPNGESVGSLLFKNQEGLGRSLVVVFTSRCFSKPRSGGIMKRTSDEPWMACDWFTRGSPCFRCCSWIGRFHRCIVCLVQTSRPEKPEPTTLGCSLHCCIWTVTNSPKLAKTRVDDNVGSWLIVGLNIQQQSTTWLGCHHLPLNLCREHPNRGFWNHSWDVKKMTQ